MKPLPLAAAKPNCPAAPRLGVLHLLLWMFGCAAAITGFRIYTDWSQVAQGDVLFVRLTHLGMGMAYGVGAVTVYVLAGSLWRRDGAFPAQAGHWLLVLGAVTAVFDGVATVAVRGGIARGWLDAWEEWCVVQWTGFGAGATVVAAVLLAVRVERRWKFAWLMLLLLAVSRSVIMFLVWRDSRLGAGAVPWLTLSANVQAFWIAAAFVASMGAIAGDVRAKIRRDWLHWTGVGMWLAVGAMELAQCARYFWLV